MKYIYAIERIRFSDAQYLFFHQMFHHKSLDMYYNVTFEPYWNYRPLKKVGRFLTSGQEYVLPVDVQLPYACSYIKEEMSCYVLATE